MNSYAVLRLTSVLILAGLCFACSSARQQKQFYTLYSHTDSAATQAIALDGGLGIGPIELPESFGGEGIVSLGQDQQIIKSHRHLWAGDFKKAISRTIAVNLSQQLAYDNVWPYPWGARHRPQKQISLLVEQLQGKLGEEVTMVVKWTLFENSGRDFVGVGREQFTVPTADASYGSYVAAINELVNQCSLAIENAVRGQWGLSGGE